MDEEVAQRVLDEVARIPPGSVSTYADVAARAGSPSPRFAGYVLANLADDDVPWHRVLPANGRPAPHIAAEQLSRLAAEGVLVVDGRVNLRRFRYHPGPTPTYPEATRDAE